MEALIAGTLQPRVDVKSSSRADEAFLKTYGLNSLAYLERNPYSGPVTVKDANAISREASQFGVTFGFGSSITANDLEECLVQCLGQPDFYETWIRKLLGGDGVPVAFEALAHPVAGLLIITASDSISDLENLIGESRNALPPFVNRNYLRYCLVLDNEGQETEIMPHVKFLFGIHHEKITFESLGSAIRRFVRQSLIPYMEQCLVAWHEETQKQSGGFAGRLVSFSKKYIGSTSPPRPETNILANVTIVQQRQLIANDEERMAGPSREYRGASGYSAISPEAQARQLADFAFFLRDYRLANQTYESLKKEFLADKAWPYLAAVQQASSITQLMLGKVGTVALAATVDANTDGSVYTAIHRCHTPIRALRCAVVVGELLADEHAALGASKWLRRALDERLVGPLSYALLMERVAHAYTRASPRPYFRKAAFWEILASREWADSQFPREAKRCLALATDYSYHQPWLYRGLYERVKKLDC